MTTVAPPRTTLPARLFPLAGPADVDRLFALAEWCVVFKAGTSDRTIDAWQDVQRVFEPREDVALGLVQVPAGRAASDRVAEATGVLHRSPQAIVVHHGRAVAHLDEARIQIPELQAIIAAQLPDPAGPPVVNPDVVSLDPYRRLLMAFIDGDLPEERFQWAFLERLARDAAWRDDDTFEQLNGLFENPSGREIRPARLVASEFQGQLAGRLAPLMARAAQLLARLGGPERRA